MSEPLGPQTIYPAIRYRDAEGAIAWLGRAFGFAEEQVDRGEDGVVHHAQLVLGGAVIMLGEHGDEPRMGDHPPDALASTVSLYIVVADPDEHHQRAQAAGARIVRALEDMEYGSREYSARDLEGNLWSLGTYQPARTRPEPG